MCVFVHPVVTSSDVQGRFDFLSRRVGREQEERAQDSFLVDLQMVKRFRATEREVLNLNVSLNTFK